MLHQSVSGVVVVVAFGINPNNKNCIWFNAKIGNDKGVIASLSVKSQRLLKRVHKETVSSTSTCMTWEYT